jgi:hypothetical protein
MDTNRTTGYTLNGSTVLPLGSSALPLRAPRDPKRVRSRIRRRFLLLMLAPLIIGGLIFLATQFLMPTTRDIEIVPSSAVIGMDRDDVAVLVYHDDSLPGPFEAMFQMRVAAIRLSDGEQLWDQRLNEDLIGDAVVLAGDASSVYIGSDHGLVVLDAATGAVRVEGDGVPGIGADAVLSASAYGYDPEVDAVVALTGSGALMQIAVGSTQAVPADAAVTARWQNTLGSGPFLDETVLTQQVEVAATPDGTRFEIVPVAEAVQRDALVITSTDPAQVVRTELVDARLLPVVGLEPRLGVLLETGQFLPGDFADIDADDIEALLQQAFGAMPSVEQVVAPAGAGQGFVLVQHRESVNADRVLLSSVDIATGKLIDTVEMQADAVRALTGPSGTTAVIAAAPESWSADRLLVLEDDGSFREVEVGAVPWWMVSFG